MIFKDKVTADVHRIVHSLETKNNVLHVMYNHQKKKKNQGFDPK